MNSDIWIERHWPEKERYLEVFGFTEARLNSTCYDSLGDGYVWVQSVPVPNLRP